MWPFGDQYAPVDVDESGGGDEQKRLQLRLRASMFTRSIGPPAPIPKV
jgi:hypothetical protein